MLLIAALGAAVFALGHDALTLSIGRALIGLGVSVALMSGFKANVLYWPIGRLPLVNAVMMTFGGLGAAMATRPVQWLLADHDWRHVFFGLALLTVAVAVYQIAATPRYARTGSGRLGGEVRGLLDVIRARLFWRAGLAPTLSFGVWVSYTSFWMAGWLRDVAHFDETSVGRALFVLSLAIVPGYFFSGMIVDLLQRRGVRGGEVLLVYGIAFLLVHLAVATSIADSDRAVVRLRHPGRHHGRRLRLDHASLRPRAGRPGQHLAQPRLHALRLRGAGRDRPGGGLDGDGAQPRPRPGTPGRHPCSVGDTGCGVDMVCRQPRGTEVGLDSVIPTGARSAEWRT